MGPDTVLWCTCGNTTLSLRIPGDFAGRVGDSIVLALDLARASIFDKASGIRL
ncbi:hypothetical protein D3C72_2134070 [compost metagenome]